MILNEAEYETVINEILNNQAILKLYSLQASYFWRNKAELKKTVDYLRREDFNLGCDTVSSFKAYKRTKYH